MNVISSTFLERKKQLFSHALLHKIWKIKTIPLTQSEILTQLVQWTAVGFHLSMLQIYPALAPVCPKTRLISTHFHFSEQFWDLNKTAGGENTSIRFKQMLGGSVWEAVEHREKNPFLAALLGIHGVWCVYQRKEEEQQDTRGWRLPSRCSVYCLSIYYVSGETQRLLAGQKNK